MKYSEKYYFLLHVMMSKAKNWSADLWKFKKINEEKIDFWLGNSSKF